MSVGFSQLTLNNMVNVNMSFSVNQEIIKSNFQILDKRLQRLQRFTKISEKQHQSQQKSFQQVKTFDSPDRISIDSENWKKKIENNQDNIKKIFNQISLNRKNYTQDKLEIIKNFDSQIKKIYFLINQMHSNQQSDDQNILLHQNMTQQQLAILKQKMKNKRKLKNPKQNISELQQRINKMQQQIKQLNDNYRRLTSIVSEKQGENQIDFKKFDSDRSIKQINKKYQKLNSQNLEIINKINTQILQYVKKDTYQREWQFQNQTNQLIKQELQTIKDQQQKNKQEIMKELLELKQKIQTNRKMLENKFKQNNQTINQLKQQLQSFNHQLILGDLTNPYNQYLKLRQENKWPGQSLLPNYLSMEINQNGYQKTSLVGFRQRIFSLQNDVKILMNQLTYQTDKKLIDKQLSHKKSSSFKESNSLNQYQSKKLYGNIKLLETKDLVKQLSQNMTKQFQKKLHDFKLAINLTMKTFEKMMENKQSKQNCNQRYTQLQDFINQLKHLISKKADQESNKKAMQRLQNKINQIIYFIYNMQSQKDALTARRGWACLSCQKELQDYRGRLGQHLVWDRLPGLTPPKLGVINMRQKTKTFYKGSKNSIYNNTTLPHIKEKK